MKILFITGEDYSARYYEDNYTMREVLRRLDDKGYCEIDDGDGQFTAELMEFKGEISNKFISFIRNELMDYDSTKDTNFYIVKEEDVSIKSERKVSFDMDKRRK